MAPLTMKFITVSDWIKILIAVAALGMAWGGMEYRIASAESAPRQITVEVKSIESPAVVEAKLDAALTRLSRIERQLDTLLLKDKQ